MPGSDAFRGRLAVSEGRAELQQTAVHCRVEVETDWRPVGLVPEFAGANCDVERRQHPPLRRESDAGLIAAGRDEFAPDRRATQEDSVADGLVRGRLRLGCGQDWKTQQKYASTNVQGT